MSMSPISGNLTLCFGWAMRELGAKNFDRDIVDTYLHTLCKTGTTRPNNGVSLMYEGKVWMETIQRQTWMNEWLSEGAFMAEGLYVGPLSAWKLSWSAGLNSPAMWGWTQLYFVLTPLRSSWASRPYGFWIRQVMHEEGGDDLRAGKKRSWRKERRWIYSVRSKDKQWLWKLFC